ncbi:hypothetical protein VNO80_08988 [Phaseolus coccineus]|uniref:Uncharacterized protein n=1 Tax=Phaseolus coccineus TaxID=3886 RepID=A0AAN9NBQ2_PHACN
MLCKFFCLLRCRDHWHIVGTSHDFISHPSSFSLSFLFPAVEAVVNSVKAPNTPLPRSLTKLPKPTLKFEVQAQYKVLKIVVCVGLSPVCSLCRERLTLDSVRHALGCYCL